MNLTNTIHCYLDPSAMLKDPSNTLLQRVPSRPITAVFVNWKKLSNTQIKEMRQAWKCPVFDRYTLVVHLFMKRSKSSEARIQAQLAELSLLRSRVPVAISMANSCGHRIHNAEQLQRIIDSQEKALLSILKGNDQRRTLSRLQRYERLSHKFPIAAVIGYTNAGKTSLIRRLSGSDALYTSPQVFATLDITHHSACLQNASGTSETLASLPGIRLLLLDTVGFMADLPIDLIAAFKATLRECLHADFILHIIDLSQPEWPALSNYVERILREIGVHAIQPTPKTKSPSQFASSPCDIHNDDVIDSSEVHKSPKRPILLRIGNKVDLCAKPTTHGSHLPIPKVDLNVCLSSKTGQGVQDLRDIIENSLVAHLDWQKKKLRLKQGSDSLRWIYANAMLTKLQECPGDPDKLMAEAFFSKVAWSLFISRFSIRPENRDSLNPSLS